MLRIQTANVKSWHYLNLLEPNNTALTHLAAPGGLFVHGWRFYVVVIKGLNHDETNMKPIDFFSSPSKR